MAEALGEPSLLLAQSLVQESTIRMLELLWAQGSPSVWRSEISASSAAGETGEGMPRGWAGQSAATATCLRVNPGALLP